MLATPRAAGGAKAASRFLREFTQLSAWGSFHRETGPWSEVTSATVAA
jgi:hypothetical protein